MKTTLVISLDEESTEFLAQQKQLDPSALINAVLHAEKQRRSAQIAQGKQSANNSAGQILESAPSASPNQQQNVPQTLEAWSDLDTHAAD